MDQPGTPATGSVDSAVGAPTARTPRAATTSGPARSVRVASTVLALQGLVLGALVVATVVWEELLVLAWAEDNAAARAVLRQGGLPALDDSPVVVPAFVPIAVVTFLTLVPLGAVLAAMLRSGARWSRSWLTVLAVLGMLGSALAVRTGAPLVFSTLGVAAGVSCAVLLVALWHPGTSRWVSLTSR